MKTLLLAFLSVLALSVSSQDIPYFYSVSLDDYSALGESTSLNNGEVWDDPEYVIPIGFEYDFLGRSINSLYMMSDFLGGSVGTLLDENNEMNVIMAYESDIIDAGYENEVSESNISYTLVGDAPNRIFKLEWDDCGFYNEYEEFGSSANRVSFQLWLYETTNNLEIHFGPHSIKNPGMLHEFGAPIVAIFEDLNFMSNEITGIYYCSGSPLESTLEVLTNIDYAEDAQFFTSDPDNGTVLHFFTSPVSVVEMEELDWVKVYPTTTNEQVYVDVIYTHCTYEIYDALGKLLVSGVLDKGLNTIDLSDLVSGIYFVRTKTDDNHITTRVFKQ